jgi:plastocyanin
MTLARSNENPTMLRTALLACALLLVGSVANAADPEVHLTIRGHRFEPAELTVPAGVKVRLLVANQDPTPEEFESYTLNREKVVSPGATVVVFVGPLKPGRYEFFGDFHPDSARGWLVVQP